MIHLPRIFVVLIALVLAGPAHAQQLVCRNVQWEPGCIDARLNKQTCPQALGAEAARGTLAIDGNKATARDLGPVADYIMTERATGDFALAGERIGAGQFIRGHGTFNRSSGKLTLFLSLGKDRNDDFIIQRGLQAECR